MDAIEVEGSEAIEVVAQFDGAIVDVTHIVRDDGADAAARHTRWLLGGGLGALGVAVVAFLCAVGGLALGRAVDAVVAVCLAGGTWAILRALDRGGWRGSFAPPRAYTIGPDPRATFAVEAEAVPTPAHALVRVDATGDHVLEVARGMTGTFTADGKTAPLDARTYRLAAGTRAAVNAGGATFYVANVPAPRRQAMPRGIDWTREVYLGGVTLVVSAFLFLVYSIPPSPQSLALDIVHGDHFARFVLMAPELPPPPKMPGPANDTASAGHAAREKAGTLGKPTATARTGQLRLPGPVSRDKVLVAAQQAVQNAGILGELRALNGSHVGAIFGPGNPLGDNANQILVGLQGTELSDAYGTGFDEIGRGPGGGGDGDKTIGAGPLGTVGFCRGTACRDGAKAYARSAPTGDLAHRAKAPDVLPAKVTLHCGAGNEGCLDKEIIRRVIRQHHNEVRYCYERGLVEKPALEGRVVTSFTIANTGRVLASAVTDTSLRTPDVERCIAEAVRRWEFPSSAQTSMVSYPFILTPPR
jgi:hypothetical protein